MLYVIRSNNKMKLIFPRQDKISQNSSVIGLLFSYSVLACSGNIHLYLEDQRIIKFVSSGTKSV